MTEDPPLKKNLLDLPGDILSFIASLIAGEVSDLNSVYCVLVSLQSLAQSSRALREAAASAYSLLEPFCPAPQRCPLQWLSVAYGEPLFSVSKFGEQAGWSDVAREVRKKPGKGELRFGASSLNAALSALGCRVPVHGVATAEKQVLALRARLPGPDQPSTSSLPWAVVLEARRVQSLSILAGEARKRFLLTASDLKRVPAWPTPVPFHQLSDKSGQLLRYVDVIRLARARHGSAEGLAAAKRARSAATASRRLASKGQGGRKAALVAALSLSDAGTPERRRNGQGGLGLSDAGTLGARFIRGLGAGESVEEVTRAVERRCFLKQSGAGLTLMALDWAACEVGHKGLNHPTLLSLEERAEREALAEFAQRMGTLEKALGQPGMPASMRAMMQRYFSDTPHARGSSA